MYRLKPCFEHVLLFNLSFKLRFFPPDLIEFLLKGICKLMIMGMNLGMDVGMNE